MGNPLKLANLIGGQPANPGGDRWLDVFEPASGQVFARCPASSRDDVERAVAAARQAAPA
ncbi:MAG: aldehyde dehydrogenase family protein, partial [Dokdonella sp.]